MTFFSTQARDTRSFKIQAIIMPWSQRYDAPAQCSLSFSVSSTSMQSTLQTLDN